MPKRRQMITRHHAQRLHRAIEQRTTLNDRLIDELASLGAQLRAHQQMVQDLEGQLKTSDSRLDKMGKDLGAANIRETAARHVAGVALNGISAVAHTLSVIPLEQIGSTLFSLERDGRHQLEKLKAVNGSSANGASA